MLLVATETVRGHVMTAVLVDVRVHVVKIVQMVVKAHVKGLVELTALVSVLIVCVRTCAMQTVARLAVKDVLEAVKEGVVVIAKEIVLVHVRDRVA